MAVFIDMKQHLRAAADVVFYAGASAAFMLMAMFAIQYDELIAPEMHRVSDAWGLVATDFGRKLASLSI
jgi:hypothetical protein